MIKERFRIHHRSQPIRTRLSNGLTILFLKTKNDPISAGQFFFPGGFVDETHKNHGLTNLLYSLLLKGTKEYGAQQIAEKIDRYGAHVGGSANFDYSTVSFYSLTEYFPEVLRIVEDILFNFQPPYEEFKKEQANELAEIQAKKEHIFTLAQEETYKRFFRGHPYSHPLSGYQDTLSSTRKEHVETWRKRLFAPNQAVLTIATNENFDHFLEKLDKTFGPNRWNPIDMGWKRTPNAPSPDQENRRTQVSVPFEQGFLFEAFPAPSVLDKDFPTVKVLASLLGGGMGARLFQSLREEKGLAYDVGAFFPTRAYQSGLFIYLGLQPNRIGQARGEIKREVERLKTELVPPEELEQVKNYILGSYLLDHQTASQKAYYQGWWEANGLGSGFDEIYGSEIQNVTQEDLLKAAQTYLQDDPWVVELAPKQDNNGADPES